MTGMRRLTGEAMRVWLGHAVHFCEISRLSLSVLNAGYKFVTAGLGTSLPVPNSVRRELRICAGLIFLTDMDLASPTLDHMYCVDSSEAGFCVMTSPSCEQEIRDNFKWRERWRFIEEELDFRATCRGDRLDPHSRVGPGWSASANVMDTKYSRWLFK